jgi:glycosyltransferase involved in cell wall biosynthesis
MKEPPRVSVILPTFNRASTLERAVRSVLEQTWDDLELIVVDDGSSDNTGEVIAGLGDPRLRSIRLEENRGAAHARNVGIEEARGDYIAFQDSDDEWLPEKLYRQMQAMDSAPRGTGVIYTDMLRVGREGQSGYMRSPEVEFASPINRETHDYQVFRLGIQTILTRRSCIEEVGRFDESLPKFIDLDLLTRLSVRYRFLHIREALVRYYSSEGITSNIYNEFVARRLLLEKYGEYIRANRAFTGYQYFCMGRALLRSGYPGDGRRWLLEAFRSDPRKAGYIVHAGISLLGEGVYARFLNALGRMREAGLMGR